MLSDLSQLYQTYRNARGSIMREASNGFFAPLLVKPSLNWHLARHRVVIVGQETLGWMWTRDNAAQFGYDWNRGEIATLSDFFAMEDAVDDLMHGYQLFNFSEQQPINARSPFWRYFRKVAGFFENEATSVLFTNVIRCAADNEFGCALWTIDEAHRVAYLEWQAGLLRQELAILDPTLVIFFTGPLFFAYIIKEFSDITFSQISDLPDLVIAEVRSDGLPMPAYRTYQPGYLNRQHKFSPVELALCHYKQAIK